MFRIPAAGPPSVYATGFSRISGLAFGPDGILYVSEFSLDFARRSPAGDVVKPAGGPFAGKSGQVVRFAPVGVTPQRLQAP